MLLILFYLCGLLFLAKKNKKMKPKFNLRKDTTPNYTSNLHAKAEPIVARKRMRRKTNI